METIVTTTPWYSGKVRFEGVSLSKLMDLVGARGKTAKVIALNDYTTMVPLDDFRQFPVILALKLNGEYMHIRDKGPLFIVYPYDSSPELQNQVYYSRSAWQVSKLSLSKGLILNRILTGIILSLFIITGYITYLVHERQSELQKLTRYTDSWSVAQIVSEYMRLESSLGAFALGVESADRDQVRLRLDIMLSQIELLQQGELKNFIHKDAGRQATVDSLIAILQQLDSGLDKMTPAQIKAVLGKMREIDGPMTSLASTSLVQGIDVVNHTHDKIQNLYYIYSIISILLITTCITLGLLMLRQNNNLRRAHVRMKLLADDLQLSKEKLQVQNRRLQYDAYHDSLTGMPNRLSFWQKLQEIVNQVRPYDGCAVVMLFDLDNFKDVNDTLGHDSGDKLLQELASRLSFSVKPRKRSIVWEAMNSP